MIFIGYKKYILSTQKLNLPDKEQVYKIEFFDGQYLELTDEENIETIIDSLSEAEATNMKNSFQEGTKIGSLECYVYIRYVNEDNENKSYRLGIFRNKNKYYIESESPREVWKISEDLYLYLFQTRIKLRTGEL